jgi:hypothetical protein
MEACTEYLIGVGEVRELDVDGFPVAALSKHYVAVDAVCFVEDLDFHIDAAGKCVADEFPCLILRTDSKRVRVFDLMRPPTIRDSLVHAVDTASSFETQRSQLLPEPRINHKLAEGII